MVYACAETRIRNGEGTWITPDMLTAYCALHEAGFAHSAEAWDNSELVGGIYGVSLGRAFFGESMFKRVANASKVAFCHLTQQLRQWQFQLIDCQIVNPHLQRLGAYEIPRSVFSTAPRRGPAVPNPAREVVRVMPHRLCHCLTGILESTIIR